MKRLLIVDDDADLCELLVLLYDVPGAVECDSATSFAGVRARYSSPRKYDLIVLDLNLGPGQPDGIAVYEWLKAEGFSGRVVFLTGHGRFHPELEKLCRADGIRILDKPAGVSQLFDLIAESRPAEGTHP